MGGDGHAETVTVLNRPGDQQLVLLHLQRIGASQKIRELARQSDDSLKLLYDANRVGAAEMLASEGRVARADMAVIDAQLALARTDLLSVSEPTMLDTDGDGLPDLLHLPLRADQLLDQKLAISLKTFERCKLDYARAEALNKSGTGSAEELRAAARHMHEAELVWLDAQLERDSIPQDSAAR